LKSERTGSFDGGRPFLKRMGRNDEARWLRRMKKYKIVSMRRPGTSPAK
jgi:hypothetical protein